MASPAVPFDTEVEGQDEFESPFPGLPPVPTDAELALAANTPAAVAPRRSSFVRPTTEEGWRRGTKAAKLQLEAATNEVERLKPTIGKLLTAVGLNLRESAAGATKQALGNITRTWADLVQPEKEPTPGTFRHLLHLAVAPQLGPAALLRLGDPNDPESWVNVTRQAGKDLAAEGTAQMKTAAELTEGLGGGLPVSTAASLSSTAGASAPALLAAPLGLPAASVAAGLQAYGNNIEGFKEKLMSLDPKLSEQEAFDKSLVPAAITGAVTGVLTRTFGGTERFIDNLAKQGVRQVGFKAALKEVFKSASLEFPEEYLDQLSQGFVERGYIDPNKKISDIFDDAAMAGLTGFALGGITTGALTGVAKAASATTGAVSRLRRGTETRGRNAQPLQIQEASRPAAVERQPAQPVTEIQTPPGAAQPSGAGLQNVQAPPLTTEVSKQAVSAVVPTPAPAPAPTPVKRAIFGGYIGDTVPSYKIPGVRPGWYRDVSADTAQKLGYIVPPAPTLEEWNAAGRPATMEVPEIENLQKIAAGGGNEQVAQFAVELQRRLPGRTVQDIAANFNTPEVQAAIDNFDGGATGFMHALGSLAKTKDDVAALKAMADSNGAAARQAMAAGDLDTAMRLVGRQPAESYEYATGIKTDGTAKWSTMEKLRPGYVPPVPDATYVAARPDQAAAAKPPASGGTQFFTKTSRPLNWQAFTTTDEAGYVVIDEEKLLAELGAGRLDGGPANNAILEYLLTRSDLHPRHGIRLYDMTPELAGALLSSQRGVAFQGRFSTKFGSPVGTVAVVLNNSANEPLSQAAFMTTLVHELVHNNVTSKLRQADPKLQKEANALYQWVKENAEGTQWASHNALESVDEFFAEAMSNGGFQKFLAGLNYGGSGKSTVTGRARSAFSAVLDIIRRLLKIPEFIKNSMGGQVNAITALDQVFQSAAQLETIQRTAGEATANLAPATPPPLPGSVQAAQVEGGTAEVGRIAEEVYQQREQAASALETLAFERTQYRNARKSMRELTELAVAGFHQRGLDPENFAFPDPTSGVSIGEDGLISADDTFVNALTVAEVPHNPANVRAMQEELFFESAARRYNSLLDQAATLQQALGYYQELGVDEKEVAKVNTMLAKVTAAADKLEAGELDGRTVGERAGEMKVAESLRQDQLGRVKALSVPPVADFFGKQVGRYRQFAERLQSGLNLAQQILAGAPDAQATARALQEVEKWMNVPTDVRDAILNGRQLTDEQRASIMAALGQVFEDFDYSQARMREMVDSRVPEINTQIRDILGKVATAKVKQGEGEVLIADVLNTLNGEEGMTGNLKSMAETQALRERVSAIRSFAMALGANVQTNQALFDWLTNPSTPKPIVPPNTSDLGTDPQTLQMIINEVARNPDFGSALLTLINASDAKVAEMPITGLEQIQEHLKKGTDGQAAAEGVAQDMIRRARNSSRLAGRELTDLLNQLDKLEIERRSLQEGMAMFEQLGAAPPFTATRNALNNSPYGLVEPMVEQNNIETTFKPFGVPGIPSHAELKLNAQNDPNFKAAWFRRVAEWHRQAQEHLNAYDTAAALHTQDPVNNPAPASLGFDLPRIRGLRDAVSRYVPGSFLELALNSQNGRWKAPWLVRAMSKLSLFRQHDFVAKMVGGIPGSDLRARLGDFVNHFLISQSIRDQFRNLPDLLHQALRSHPEFGMNLANYRDHFNELAHWGRQFGSPVRPGFVLPRSGRVVTAADMAYLQRERAYQEQLRRRVTESNPTQGVRVRTATRTLVRPGASVGDQGMPRFPGRQADTFIADVRTAYGEPAGTFSYNSNLGPNSQEPIVAFWNRNLPLVIQHVLDVRRTDRSMNLSPGAQAAELQLANDWALNGVPSINSLDDLVNLLVSAHPPTPGQNPREVVVGELNDELRQFRDAAQRIANDRAERDQARNSRPDIAFSADNEFTRPAANLELPSPLYDYGAITPADHITMSSRANHERIVGYATAVRRAIAELENRLNRFNAREITAQQAATEYGGNIQEMQDVLGILRQIEKDFASAYAAGSFTGANRGPIQDTLGFLTSAILALPTVGIRNMTQGQFAVYAMSRAMGLAGHRMTIGRALKAMPATLIRFGLHAVDGLVRNTNVGLGLITGQNRHYLENAIRVIGNAIAGTDFRANAQRIADLGLDNREEFMQRFRRIIQETQEFVDPADQAKAWTIGGRRVGKTAAIPFKVIRALFDKVGVQQYDFAINTTALNASELLRQRLQQLAMDYGQARTGLGQFDPTNPAWNLRPDEWATFPSQAENADSLATFRQFLEGAAGAEGFQLERSMWNYFQQRQQGVQNPQLMTPQQFDGITRKLLSEFNASTPANRPSASAATPIVRNLLLLQGYPSDLMLKLFSSAFSGIRDRGTVANLLVKTPAIAFLALMAILIGMFTGGVTGAWEKYVRGRQPSLATPIDGDFYTSVRRLGEGVVALGAAQLGYLGDLILAMRGEVRGNRGFDPTGRILGVSLISRFLNAARTAWNTGKAGGTVGDVSVPFQDVGRSMVPFWLEMENAFRGQPAIKQAERGIRGEAQVQGLLEGKGGFVPSAGGPTTVFRRNLGDAVSRWHAAQQAGDQAKAAQELANARAEMAKLEEYHFGKYVAAGKDQATARTLAQRDVWNDYQDVNPVVAAMLGKRPTQAQYELLMQGITGERRKVVDAGVGAWSAGAMALFGRQGNITREQVAAGRAQGVGRSLGLPGMNLPGLAGLGRASRAPRISAPVPAAVRSVRSRIRRAAVIPSPRLRTGTRQRRPGTPRPPRIRSPRLGRNTRPRTRRLAPSRRRPYALA